MRETESIKNLAPDFLRIPRNDRILVQRIRPQPRSEIGLYRDLPLHANLGDLGLDVNHPNIEANHRRLQARDFAAKHTRTDARKEAQRKVRHEYALPEGLHIRHELG